MPPETYLSGEKIDPMSVPEFERDLSYVKFDIGAMGEFDVAVLIEQYARKELSDRLYPEWRGGYYYAARSKNDAAAPLGLLYVSRWSSAEKAALEDFTGAVPRRLRHQGGAETLGVHRTRFILIMGQVLTAGAGQIPPATPWSRPASR